MLTMLLPLILAQAAAAQAAGRAAPDLRAPSEIVAAAPAAEWVAIPVDELLVLDLPPGADKTARRIVIQLMPAPFASAWIGNIRKLADAHWWDGTSINRVQDNYVVQWGDASEKKPMPSGLATPPETAYTVDRAALSARDIVPGPADVYAARTAFYRGWPIGMDGIGVDGAVAAEAGSAGSGSDAAGRGRANVMPAVTGARAGQVWPVHCYGMVGVGRDVSPNTGTGAELYVVIGHAPRHLDRNIALVGRVIEGIEHLSSLPRGSLGMGFYDKAAQRVPIVQLRLASDLPVAERPRFEYLSTRGTTWARYATARANREDAFFIRPAGSADVCNIPVPVRRAS